MKSALFLLALGFYLLVAGSVWGSNQSVGMAVIGAMPGLLLMLLVFVVFGRKE